MYPPQIAVIAVAEESQGFLSEKRSYLLKHVLRNETVVSITVSNWEAQSSRLKTMEYSLLSLCDGLSAAGGKDIRDIEPSNLCSIGHLRSSRVTK
jgi:hypothetical protein